MIMSSISVQASTKSALSDLKDDDETWDEFVQSLISAYKRDNGEMVDIDEMVERIDKRVASNVEVAAYRGVQEGLERGP